MKKIHLYQFRHVFADDDCVGKYDSKSYTVRIFEQFAEDLQPVLAFFRSMHGINAKGIVGTQEETAAVPLLEFPAEVLERFDPQLGDLSRAALTWARENWTPEQFATRYAGRAEFDGKFSAPVPAPFHGLTDPKALSLEEIDEDDADPPPGLLEAVSGNMPSVADPSPPRTTGEWEDDSDEVFKSVQVDPTKHDGATGQEPDEETPLPAPQPAPAPPGNSPVLILQGDDILRDGKKIAALWGEEKQLRMASGHAGDRKAVEAFLKSKA